jgi:hypothetical protein
VFRLVRKLRCASEVREKKQVLFPVRLVPFEGIRDWECFDADAGLFHALACRETFGAGGLFSEA